MDWLLGGPFSDLMISIFGDNPAYNNVLFPTFALVDVFLDLTTIFVVLLIPFYLIVTIVRKIGGYYG